MFLSNSYLKDPCNDFQAISLTSGQQNIRMDEYKNQKKNLKKNFFGRDFSKNCFQRKPVLLPAILRASTFRFDNGHSADRSTTAKNRILSPQYRYCSEQYRCALKKFFFDFLKNFFFTMSPWALRNPVRHLPPVGCDFQKSLQGSFKEICFLCPTTSFFVLFITIDKEQICPKHITSY